MYVRVNRKVRLLQQKKLLQGAAILAAVILIGKAMFALVPAIGRAGEQLCLRFGRILCQTILLEEKPVLKYLFYEEEKRDVFRFFSNQLLGAQGWQVCAAMRDTEEEKVFDVIEEQQEILTADGALLEGVLNENAGMEPGYMKISYTEAGNIQKKERLEVNATITGGEGDAGEVEAAMAENTTVGGDLADAAAVFSENYSLELLSTADALLSEYYIVDSVTSTLPELFQAEELLNSDLGVEKIEEGYQVLIYHTHGTESYIDSRPGEVSDTVRGPGEALAQYLRTRGYTVYHDMTAYDWKDGKSNRNYAYSTAGPQIEAFLKEHPETEIIIDLHRDSGAKRVSEVNGKQTARVMLFNGLCRNASGPISYLDNPNLSDNLAFSLQVNLVGRVLYPGLMHKIYLKNYRYNQHFCERYLLIELGTENNTVEEAYNAMEPLAEVLDVVLSR